MKRLVLWLVGVAVAGAFGGWPAALAAVVVAGLDLVWGVRPTAVLGWALGVLSTVPFVWLLSNRARLGQPTFDLVVRAPWPGRLAAVALTLLVIGVVLAVSPDLRASSDAAGEREA